MGVYLNLSKAMQQKAEDIFRKADSNVFRLDLKLVHSVAAIVPKMIHGWHIVHNFDKEYHEKSEIIVNISLGEAEYLLRNPDGWEAMIVMNHVDPHYYKILQHLDPDTRKYKVIVNDKTKAEIQNYIAAAEMTQSNDNGKELRAVDDNVRAARRAISLDLVEPKIFELSKLPVNSVAKDVAPKDYVHYFANALNIKKVNMVEPDNNTQYKHMFTPPFQTIEVLDKLQKDRGVYNQGMGYYYFKDTLYVYPEFDTSLNRQLAGVGELHLYRLPVDAYPGNPSYHLVDEAGNLHIVLTAEAKAINVADMGMQSGGNYVVAKRADTEVDTDTTQVGKEAKVNHNNGIAVAAEGVKSSNPGYPQLRYAGNTNNALALSSDMAAYMCMIMQTSWPMAWPDLIKPGQKIVYHYETKDGLDTIPGVISSAEYTAVPVDGWPVGLGNSMRYAWTAMISCRLAAMEEPACVANNNDNISEDTKKSMEAAKAAS